MDTISTMMIELPMFTYASQCNISYALNVTNNNQTCMDFYQNTLLLSNAEATALCSDSSNTFNFVNNPTNYQGYIKTCVALTSIYLYGNNYNTANAGYYATFLALTNWTSFQISQQVHSPTSIFTYFVTNEIAAPVYAHYSTVDGNICNSQTILGCSFSNLTYNQWLHSSVLYYPLPGIEIEPIYSSYVIFYSDYTLLKFVPEVSYWQAMSGLDYPAEITILDVYESFSETGLFNQKINQDIWLNVTVPGHPNVFTDGYNTVYWLRYLALNFGLGGWFAQLTPHQVINGYYDATLQRQNQLPLYLGGDLALMI
jgi:hypothetical protein